MDLHAQVQAEAQELQLQLSLCPSTPVSRRSRCSRWTAAAGRAVQGRVQQEAQVQRALVLQAQVQQAASLRSGAAKWAPARRKLQQLCWSCSACQACHPSSSGQSYQASPADWELRTGELARKPARIRHRGMAPARVQGKVQTLAQALASALLLGQKQQQPLELGVPAAARS